MSDEYVAGLLKKDAKDSTTKYSALGLQVLLPRRYVRQSGSSTHTDAALVDRPQMHQNPIRDF